MSKYDDLRILYPKCVSKEQLCKICGMVKDTAWIYLHSRVIPCEDTGNKTRRYKIHINGVICFLERRDKGGTQVRADLRHMRPRAPQKLPDIKNTATYKNHIRRYFKEELLQDIGNKVTPVQIAEVSGLSTTVVQRHILHGNIEAVVECSSIFAE